MKDYGELTLYVKNIEFTNKKDLENKLKKCLENAEDLFVKNSIKTALSILEDTTEEELKEIKETF